MFVTNTDEDPVPVATQGTVAVDVQGKPAVSIDSASLPTLGAAPADPFFGSVLLGIGGSSANADTEVFLQVPEDKTLVLEEVSGHIRRIDRTPRVEIRVRGKDPVNPEERRFLASHYVRFTPSGQR